MSFVTNLGMEHTSVEGDQNQTGTDLIQGLIIEGAEIMIGMIASIILDTEGTITLVGQSPNIRRTTSQIMIKINPTWFNNISLDTDPTTNPARKINMQQDYNLNEIQTPVNARALEDLLIKSNYDKTETKFLIQGFTKGFSIGYSGPLSRQNYSNNIPFTVGDKFDMWDKIMSEVAKNRVSGPYLTIPYQNFMQSPIGLVPKAGNKTRLIFHLSYQFSEEEKSLNCYRPKEICSVKYNDLDYAVHACLNIKEMYQSTGRFLPQLFFAKSDLVSAFRMLPIKPEHRCWLIFKATNPYNNQVAFFVDKCLPFGASISCSHFQRFSNALRHLLEFLTGKKFAVTNYLDDFLFIDTTAPGCNALVSKFLKLCSDISLPVSLEKTEWATTRITFLGILLDGKNFVLSIPLDKQEKARKLLEYFQDKKKATVKQLQVLTGYLNFLSKAIFPGRAFTRRIYAKYSGAKDKLKPYHHVYLDKEFKFDCQVWREFLQSRNLNSIVCRPMIDLNLAITAQELNFYTDASANATLGFGGIFNRAWICQQWEPGFIATYNPSIEYLELFALCAAILTWGGNLRNKRVIVYCDNMSVVNMINKSSSSCKNCMVLIRLLVLSGLTDNRRVFAKHVVGKNNELADSLSRLQMSRFTRLSSNRKMDLLLTKISSMIWPASKLWVS